MQLFLKASYQPYEKVTYKTEADAEAARARGEKLYQIYDENGKPTSDYWRYVEEYDPDDPDAGKNLYNCATLKINQELVQTPSKLGFVKETARQITGLARSCCRHFRMQSSTSTQMLPRQALLRTVIRKSSTRCPRWVTYSRMYMDISSLQ